HEILTFGTLANRLKTIFTDEVEMPIEEGVSAELPAISADRLREDETRASLGVDAAELGRYTDAHAHSKHECFFNVEMFQQQLSVLSKDLPGQDFDPAARQSGFATIIGDDSEVPRQRLDCVHVLPFAMVPALQRRLEAARRHHEKDRPGALLHI